MTKHLTKQKKAAPTPKRTCPETVCRIQDLLHTLRELGQHEDELCSLLHAVERTGHPDQELSADLLRLLEALPSRRYMEEVAALRHDLHGSGLAAAI